MPRPCDVYAKELATLSRGHAVLNPRRTPLQSGSGLRTPLDIGDVAYDCNGQLIRLFNCLMPPEKQDEDCVFPEDFEVLELASHTRRSARRSSPRVNVTHNRSGTFYSKGIRLLKAEASVSVSPALGGASIAFSTRNEQGAVLLTSSSNTVRISPNRPAFEKYMIKHYDSWCALLVSEQLDVRPEDLMLVTGVETTKAWSNLVFDEHELRGEFSVEAPFVCGVGGRVAVSAELSRTQSATRDSGPNPEDLQNHDGSDSGYESDPSPSPGAVQDDQVVFVRALRGKKRSFLGMKISASAEPKDLDEDHSDTDSSDGSVLSLESVGDTQPRADFLTPVLDFILENSEVDMAIVHDDDYSSYCQHLQRGCSPPIDFVQYRVNDGLAFGMLNKHSSVNNPGRASLMEAALGGEEHRSLIADEPRAIPETEPLIGLSRKNPITLGTPIDRTRERSDLDRSSERWREFTSGVKLDASGAMRNTPSSTLADAAAFISDHGGSGDEESARARSTKATALHDAGNLSVHRYDRLGEVRHLIEDAISMHRCAVGLAPVQDKNEALTLVVLGKSLALRYEELGDLQDLQNATSMHRRAADFTPDEDSTKPLMLQALGNLLARRYKHLGDLDDIGESISALRRAVELMPCDHPDNAPILMDTANSFLSRFEHLGDLSDIEDSISAYHRSVELTPGGRTDKAPMLNRTARRNHVHIALRHREPYQTSGRAAGDGNDLGAPPRAAFDRYSEATGENGRVQCAALHRRLEECSDYAVIIGALEEEAEDPVLLYFARDHGLRFGTPAGSGGDRTLQGDMRSNCSDGMKRRRTIDVVVNALDEESRDAAFIRGLLSTMYVKTEVQVRTKKGSPQSEDSYTFKRLVNQLKGKAWEIIDTHADRATRDPQESETQKPRWAIGSAQGRITVDDLELLAIVVVSQGAVMPILKLRNGLVSLDSDTLNRLADQGLVRDFETAFFPGISLHGGRRRLSSTSSKTIIPAGAASSQDAVMPVGVPEKQIQLPLCPVDAVTRMVTASRPVPKTISQPDN